MSLAGRDPALVSTSTIRRTEGGGWGKSTRFSSHVTDTPGPHYSLPPLFDARTHVPGAHHVQGPVYKPESEDKSSPGSRGMPHPTKDRSAWMIGVTKDDMAYYADIATSVGPAFYKPSINPTREAAPKAAFAKNPRFTSLTHRYISKEHNDVNLCTASQGPKYYPKRGPIDWNTAVPPAHSFGSKNMKHRSSFLDSVINGGYLYQARPATSDPKGSVSPASYQPNDELRVATAPRPKWTKADRFKSEGKIFISRKHSRSMGGMHSPGPIYQPTNYDVSATAAKPRTGSVPTGTWTP